MVLDSTFSFIEKKLNSHFKLLMGIDEDKVVLSNIVNQKGDVEEFEDNKIVCTLVGLEKEGLANSQHYYKNISDKATIYANPPLHLNLYVLFSVHYTQSNYTESLKMLSMLIAYFQGNNSFTSLKDPDLSEEIQMLNFEILEQNQFDRSQMWSMIGAKYVPSIVYKVRMLTFDTTAVKDKVNTLGETVPTVNRK